MTDILDAEKLEEAIKFLAYMDSPGTVGGTVIAAARAHLATLPRLKEIKVERWGVFEADDSCVGTWDNAEAAQAVASRQPGWFIVRLAGTAKVRA